MCCCDFAPYGSGAVRFKIRPAQEGISSYKLEVTNQPLQPIPARISLTSISTDSQRVNWGVSIPFVNGGVSLPFFQHFSQHSMKRLSLRVSAIGKHNRKKMQSPPNLIWWWWVQLENVYNTHCMCHTLYVSDVRLILFIQLHWRYQNSLQFWNRKHQWLSRLSHLALTFVLNSSENVPCILNCKINVYRCAHRNYELSMLTKMNDFQNLSVCLSLWFLGPWNSVP